MNRRQRQRKLHKWSRRHPERYSRYVDLYIRWIMKDAFTNVKFEPQMFTQENCILKAIKRIDSFCGDVVIYPIDVDRVI